MMKATSRLVSNDGAVAGLIDKRIFLTVCSYVCTRIG